jgi:outer membrane protein assembly factor BamB
MVRARVCLWLLVAGACQPALGQADFIPPEPLQQAGLVKYWELQLLLEKGQRLQTAYLVDDHLYLGTQDGYAFAVHAPTGLLRWLRPITRSGYPVRRPCHVGDRVILVTPGDIQVYDRRTGDPLARHDLRFPAGTGATSDGERIVVGGLDGRLYALDVQTQYLQWRAVTGGPISSNPALQGEAVFVANDRGIVNACTRSDKTFRWRFAAYGPVTADLVADDRGVFVASRDFSLYLLDLGYGNVRWRARLSGPLYEAPVVTAEYAYQYCPADGLVAVDATSIGNTEDRVRWKLPTGREALTVHDGRVFVLTQQDTIVAVSVKDGTVAATIPACGFTLPMPAPSSATIFLAAPDGRVFCARPRGVAPLQKEDILEALRSSGAGKEAGTPAAQPAVQPVAKAEDWLATKWPGAPSGGKSNVSREYKPGTGSE